jgi:NADPH:quinone reductase-like Zn-dependent oxidoreductase
MEAMDQIDRPTTIGRSTVVATEATMQAIVQAEYGAAAGVLKLRDVPKPVAKDGEVVVRVQAASIHVGDAIIMAGRPYFLRLATGLRKPKNAVPGTDVSGTVETVGEGVTGLRVGDAVFGWCTGAFTEYACAPADHFVPKPANLSFEQAAAIGVSATTALQLLRDQGKVQPGQKVLINGASGGVGPFAVQIAKAFGAEVTGVCSTGNVDMVRSIGANHVVDYTKEDFTKGEPRYDFILDNVANHSLADTRHALAPNGVLQPNGGGHSSGRWIGSIGGVIKVALIARFVRQQLGPSVKFQNRADLLVLTELVEAGKVTPVIDGTYPLSRTAEAMSHVAEGHARGTVVITVSPATA